MSETIPASSTGFSLRGVLPSNLVNAAIPTLLYSLAKSQFAASELMALSIAAIFPLIGSIVGLIRESFVTGALGIACFVSLLMPKPLMFYLAGSTTDSWGGGRTEDDRDVDWERQLLSM